MDRPKITFDKFRELLFSKGYDKEEILSLWQQFSDTDMTEASVRKLAEFSQEWSGTTGRNRKRTFVAPSMN